MNKCADAPQNSTNSQLDGSSPIMAAQGEASEVIHSNLPDKPKSINMQTCEESIDVVYKSSDDTAF